MEGHYVENYGKEDAQDVTEQSFFVIGDAGDMADPTQFKEFLKWEGKKFDQDSIFYYNVKDKNGYLIGTNSTGYPGMNKEEKLGKWHPQKIGEFYSIALIESYIFFMDNFSLKFHLFFIRKVNRVKNFIFNIGWG